jgi:hypothetical protein
LERSPLAAERIPASAVDIALTRFYSRTQASASLTVQEAGLASYLPVAVLVDEQRHATPVAVNRPG